MTLCDNCGERPAAIHLTQIVDNSVTTAHLCEQCAAEKGVQTNASIAKLPLSGFLAKGGQGAAAALPGGADAGACGFCGATLQDFRATGRLGCAHCYASFESHLRELLRRIHGAAHHVGKLYLDATPVSPDESPKVLVELKDRLRRAVESENFELAAELRDRIRSLE
jgi:protein arginine kinase activator